MNNQDYNDPFETDARRAWLRPVNTSVMSEGFRPGANLAVAWLKLERFGLWKVQPFRLLVHQLPVGFVQYHEASRTHT
jgi:hypothetical protein